MKKNILFVLGFLFFFSPLWGAVSYSSLWKKVAVAEQKDLPRDEIRLMKQIATKAETEKEWGQYLKARLRIIEVWQTISEDSLRPQLEREIHSLNTMTDGDSVRMAVCNTVIARLYKDCYSSLEMPEDSARMLSQKYFGMALSDMPLLARTKSSAYEPLVIQGDASRAFGNDLLHVIGMEAEEYKLLSAWYRNHDNRAAACLADFLQTQKERHEDVREIRRSFYLHTLDSLINEYRYLPEAGEIAIERFNYMDQATDASAKEKVDYIDNALREWPTWSRMAILRNARTRIQLPSFHIQFPSTSFIPDKPQKVLVTALKNIGQLKLTVTKVNMTGAEEFDPQNESDLKMIRNFMEKTPASVDSRTYYGLPDYLEIRDSLTIDSLKPGIYLAEITTDNSTIPAERLLLHVSNLQLVDMDMPGQLVRLIVADATTGQPVPGAQVDLKFTMWSKGRRIYENKTLCSDHNGEVAFTSNGNPIRYRVTLGTDNAMGWQYMGTDWRTGMTDEQKSAMHGRVDVFTDRSIYRPGQKIEVSVLASQYNRHGDASVRPSEKLRVVLHDSKSAVDTCLVTTDEWGVATASFPLSETIRTGYCSIVAEGLTDKSLRGSQSLRVEEYKKPTFTVYLDPYTQPYAKGDTISLRGHAKSFTGVDLQNAKVTYTINSDEQKDSVRTNENGEFSLRVPLAIPDNGAPSGRRRFHVSVCARITSLSGESHEVSTSVPVADKPLMVEVEGLTDKVCLEHLPDVRFKAVNPAGKQTKDSVTVCGLVFTPGEHTVTAYCKGDTISRKYVVFSLKDTCPQVETPDWFYFNDGNLQLGTTEHHQTVYYAIVSEKDILEEGRFVLDSCNQNRTFKYREEWGDGIAMRYSWVRDGALYTHEANVTRPVEADTLQLEWKTFRDHTLPGSKENWTLTIKQPTASSQQPTAKFHFMATMYDKSLDELNRHGFSLNSRFSVLNPPFIYASLQYRPSDQFVFGEAKYKPEDEPEQKYSCLDIPYFYFYGATTMLLDNVKPMRTMATASFEGKAVNSQYSAVSPLAADPSPLDMRSVNADQAFWLPSAVTNDKGEVQMTFQLPDNLTTWRFLGVAHDKQMHCGNIASEIVVQKALMLQPNMPRFLREGDKARISAQIVNTTSKALSGIATLTLVDEATGKTVFSQKQKFSVGANSTDSTVFSLTSHLSPLTYICRMTATAGKYADGEQDRLCVMSNKEQVITTKAFTQTEAGVKTIDVASLTGRNATDASVEVRYTNNPALLMLEALDNMKQTTRDDAVSLATAVFAAAVREKLNTDASKATFNITHLTLLQDLQNSDGSFSWCPQMPASYYITEEVTRILLRAQKISPSEVCRNITDRAMEWLDNDAAQRIEEIKKDSSLFTLHSSLFTYLYLQTLQGTLSKQGRQNAKYLLGRLSRFSALASQTSIYDKAQLAVICAKHPLNIKPFKPLELLSSILQYAVSTPEMGTYFDTPKAGYSWCDYKIPTQTAVIEALQCVASEEKTLFTLHSSLLTSLRQWLLQEKRTQQWSTPLNSSSAVYAFFGGDSSEATQTVENTVIKADGRKVRTTKSGTLETWKSNSLCKKIVFDKKSKNISWGAVLVTAMQPIEDVEARGEGLTVKREYLDQQGNVTSLDKVKVGDKIKVRITFDSQRDLDFVEISDHRAACLEPADQLSSCHWTYYESFKDKETVYYIQKLSKGKHVYTATYYVDRSGQYQPGIVTAKCAYAPEYCAYGK